MKRYEAMFLFDSAVVREWTDVEKEVRRLCDRIGAELLVCVKFDERKLAYEINRRKRGTYVLTYIDAPPDRITDLERDTGLSEVVLRMLVLRAENLTEERLAELKAHSPETPLSPPAGDGRGRYEDDRRGWGGRRGERWSGPRSGPDERPAGQPPASEKPAEEREAEVVVPAETSGSEAGPADTETGTEPATAPSTDP